MGIFFPSRGTYTPSIIVMDYVLLWSVRSFGIIILLHIEVILALVGIIYLMAIYKIYVEFFKIWS